MLVRLPLISDIHIPKLQKGFEYDLKVRDWLSLNLNILFLIIEKGFDPALRVVEVLLTFIS